MRTYVSARKVAAALDIEWFVFQIIVATAKNRHWRTRHHIVPTVTFIQTADTHRRDLDYDLSRRGVHLVQREFTKIGYRAQRPHIRAAM